MNIIAVDDERIVLEVLEKAIQKAAPDAQIHSFIKPSEALSYTANKQCDVAFLDIEMRDINGLVLAKRLKEQNPKTNVVFVTGYNQYMGNAFSMHVSGYVMKPVTPELVRQELDNLRNMPEPVNTQRARAQTFGNFELFIDDEPVKFKLARTKELLAYLIDRQGASCNTAEICAVLFEDESGTQSSRSHFRTLISDLTASLRKHDMEALLVKQRNSFSIDIKLLDCDMYRFQRGDISAVNAYAGEYMLQYSWAEMRTGQLVNFCKN